MNVRSTHRRRPTVFTLLLLVALPRMVLPLAAEEPAAEDAGRALVTGPPPLEELDQEYVLMLGVVAYAEEVEGIELAREAILPFLAAMPAEESVADARSADLESVPGAREAFEALFGYSRQNEETGRWDDDPGAISRLFERMQEMALRQGVQLFSWFFTPTAMRLNIGEHSMVWTSLAGAPAVGFANHPKRMIYRVDALRRTHLPTTRTRINVTPESGSQTIAGYDARRHSYGPFVMTVGLPPVAAALTVQGTIWLAPEHPGREIVTRFFTDWASAVEASGWMGQMGYGMMLHLMSVSARGLPMQGVMTSMTRSFAAPLALPSASAFEVAAAEVLPMSPALWNYIRGGDWPEDYELVELSPPEMPDMSRPIETMREHVSEGLRDTTPGRLFQRFRRGLRRRDRALREDHQAREAARAEARADGGEGAETGGEGDTGGESAETGGDGSSGGEGDSGGERDGGGEPETGEGGPGADRRPGAAADTGSRWSIELPSPGGGASGRRCWGFSPLRPVTPSTLRRRSRSAA